MTTDHELLIIGGGSAGVRLARIAAKLGVKTAVIESAPLGGTCVNLGCVPKKLLVQAARLAEQFHIAPKYGWQTTTPQFDWNTLIANKNQEIARLNKIYHDLLINVGVKLINGTAKLIDPHSVTVNQQIIKAKTIVIATGGKPYVPTIPNTPTINDQECIITSEQAFFLPKLPQEIIIVGGGYIAVEFAGIFNSLGVNTTLVYRGDKLMRGFDHELQDKLATTMQTRGINIKFNCTVNNVQKINNKVHATLTDQTILQADHVMYATGRHPNTNDLGLAEIGVQLSEIGAVQINEYYQTTVPSIYALGDVTDRIPLTPVAIAEAEVLANHLFNQVDKPLDYSMIPTCVFSQPEIASIGMTQKQAQQKYHKIDVYTANFTPMHYALTDIKEKTFMKLIVANQTDQVLGIHMIGAGAGEMIQSLSVALTANATKTNFDNTMAIHPTVAEEFVSMKRSTTITDHEP